MRPIVGIGFRVFTADRRVKFAGTDNESWFDDSKDAFAHCDKSRGERVFECDGTGVIWEVFD